MENLTPIERIIKFNNLIASDTKSNEMKSKEGRVYTINDHDKYIEVITGDHEIIINVELTTLYTHILAPRIIIRGDASQNGAYPKISSDDAFVKLYLAKPGDLISLIRLVAFKGAGTQKTETIYQVV